MTSSLVGSEMCIRDRAWGQLHLQSQVMARPFTAIARPIATTSNRLAFQPCLLYTSDAADDM
eukprot:7631435-Prorocentrum_lima.AAC.1